MATCDTAEALEIDNEVGTLARGMVADLASFEGDPGGEHPRPGPSVNRHTRWQASQARAPRAGVRGVRLRLRASDAPILTGCVRDRTEPDTMVLRARK